MAHISAVVDARMPDDALTVAHPHQHGVKVPWLINLYEATAIPAAFFEHSISARYGRHVKARGINTSVSSNIDDMVPAISGSEVVRKPRVIVDIQPASTPRSSGISSGVIRIPV